MALKKYAAIGLAGCIAAVAITAAALATEAQDGDEAKRVQFSGARGPVPPFRGGTAEGLLELARPMPTVTNAVLRPATDPGAAGLELTFDLSVRSFEGESIARPMWEGHLFAGAVADRLSASQLPALVSVGATLVRSDGVRDEVGGGLGHVVRDQRFQPVTPQIVSAIRGNAESAGLRVVNIATVKAIQDAVAITVVADSPREALAALGHEKKSVIAAVLGVPPTNYEGVYFELRNTEGTPAYIAGTAPRAGAAFAWGNQGLGVHVGKGMVRIER